MDYEYGQIICNNLWSSWYTNSKFEQMMANLSTEHIVLETWWLDIPTFGLHGHTQILLSFIHIILTKYLCYIILYLQVFINKVLFEISIKFFEEGQTFSSLLWWHKSFFCQFICIDTCINSHYLPLILLNEYVNLHNIISFLLEIMVQVRNE